MKIRSWVWSCGPTVFRERFWGTVLRMKHSRQKWIGYLLFDAAIRPSFVARLRLSPRLGRIFLKKQTSNQLDAQLVIAICDELSLHCVEKWYNSCYNNHEKLYSKSKYSTFIFPQNDNNKVDCYWNVVDWLLHIQSVLNETIHCVSILYYLLIRRNWNTIRIHHPS